VAGYEIVTARLSVPGRAAAVGEARCPAGKAALGGGVGPDPATPRKEDDSDQRMTVTASGPLLVAGGPAGGYGWTVTVKNNDTAPLALVVAAVCVTLR
jgi:hypothetical protein